MSDPQPDLTRPTRRAFLRACLAMPVTTALAACVAPPAAAPAEPAQAAEVALPTVTPTPVAGAAPAQVLAPTPACPDDDDVTPAQTEGPFYTPNSPERRSLREPGITGTPLVVAGYVLTTDCRPIAGALLDFWHCDDAGVYDNVGYRLRGHQFSDDAGRYHLETILPAVYTGRTRHIHVKVQPPNQPVLTTQLYFPDEPANQIDGIFRPELVMAVQDDTAGKVATFAFVLSLT
jgi:protocatechuate 3,4-dioxygenase beta subunit